ncbi:hypothetical protein JOF28_000285 [Leucobacter exalbidus]|uniref:Uncharacterized protein n=1 Tax=Leucobacter exalbidus TaxID=662960 RepID=A0A940T2Q7_9MICO|nr:hypothetical protein [Leucobacter exalbidus]MBP1325053.1 hypothetical protein [Leucobacter exalbidus]
MSTVTGEVVHHLYQRGPALDLIPYCGAIPGRDRLTGSWHTGHDRDELLLCLEFGLTLCLPCASPAALGGFTPLILSEDGE